MCVHEFLSFFLPIFQPPSLYPPWFFSVLYLLLILSNIPVILIHNYSTDHHWHVITLKSIPVSLTSLLNSWFIICSSLQGFPGGTSGKKKKKKKIHLLMQEMQETWVPFLGREDLLEEEMATYSSSFAWRIPWTEEPGRMQSMKLQIATHNWAHRWECGKSVPQCPRILQNNIHQTDLVFPRLSS